MRSMGVTATKYALRDAMCNTIPLLKNLTSFEPIGHLAIMYCIEDIYSISIAEQEM